MQAKRRLLISVTSLVVLVLLAFGVLFSSAFQTWALRQVLAGRADLTIEFTRVSISLGSATVEGLRLEKDGAVLRLPFLRAELPVYAATQGRVDLQALEARGWVLDLSHYAAALPLQQALSKNPDSAVAAAFAGIFPQLRLPVDLSLAKLDLDGDLIFPAAQAGQVVRSRLALSGGGLGMGKEGRLQLELTGDLGDGAPVREIKVRADLLLAMGTPRTVSALSCEMLADARGPQFPEGAHLNLAARAWQQQGTEAYSLELKREQVTVLSFEAQLAKPYGALEGRWSVKASDVDFTPFVLGHALPSFDVSGQGLFALVLPSGTLQLTGALAVRADRLGVLDSRLAALGAISTQASFELVSAKEYLRVRRLKLDVSAPGPVAELEVLQGFELVYQDTKLKLSDPAKQLLRVQASALPVAWLAPFVPDYALRGGVLSGEWTWAAHASGFSLLSTREARVKSVSLARGGQPLLEDLDLSANFRFDYLPAGWQVDLSSLNVSRDQKALADFHLKLGQRKGDAQPLVVQGSGQLALAGVLAQPFIACGAGLEAGTLQLELKGTFAATSECHLKVQVDNMVRSGEALPSASLELRGTLAPDGSFSFTAPLQFENKRLGRISDLSFEGKLQALRLPLKLEAKLLGRTLALEDLQLLTALLEPRALPSAPLRAPGASLFGGEARSEASQSPDADTVAAWSVVEGRIQLTLGRLQLNSSSELAEVKAELELSPGELKIDQLRARGENSTQLSFDASVIFEKGARPYGLLAQLKATAFDVSGFTSSRDAFSPTLTAKFDITSKLRGQGTTIGDLFDHSTGSFQMLSRGGKCRLLRSDITEFLQGKSNLGTFFMGSITSLLSSKSEKEAEARDGAKLDEYSKIAMELAAYFAEIPFDQLSVALVRDSDLNLKIQDFALISPLVRLTGAGAVTHQAGKAFADQPMELQLQVATRGRIAELFGKANMLQSTKDNLGYQPLTSPVQLRGTLGRPDSSEFKELLRKVTLQKAEAFLGRLIGGGR